MFPYKSFLDEVRYKPVDLSDPPEGIQGCSASDWIDPKGSKGIPPTYQAGGRHTKMGRVDGHHEWLAVLDKEHDF